MSGSTNSDILAIGSGITAVGVASQFPTLSGAMSAFVSALSPTFIGGSVELGVSIAAAIGSVVTPPVVIAAGALLVYYELSKKD